MEAKYEQEKSKHSATAKTLEETRRQLETAQQEKTALSRRLDVLDALENENNLLKAERAKLEQQVGYLTEALKETKQALAQLEEKSLDASDLETRMRLLAAREKEFENVIAKLVYVEESLDYTVTCLSCLSLLEKPVTCVPCGHTFCGKCCPTDFCSECGPKSDVETRIPNLVLEQLSSKFQYKKQVLAGIKAQIENSQGRPLRA
eukprot:GILI01036458.1.p1 GENE.GILI01036458.1~~GILI01036458.1.p1  ORF type:complete len:222 (-),score=64.32 GILI01036458.1:151-765(-)